VYCVHTTTAVRGNKGQFGDNNAIFVTVTANANISKVRKFSSVVALIRLAVRLETVEFNFYQQIAPHVFAQVLLVLPPLSARIVVGASYRKESR